MVLVSINESECGLWGRECASLMWMWSLGHAAFNWMHSSHPTPMRPHILSLHLVHHCPFFAGWPAARLRSCCWALCHRCCLPGTMHTRSTLLWQLHRCAGQVTDAALAHLVWWGPDRWSRKLLHSACHADVRCVSLREPGIHLPSLPRL